MRGVERRFSQSGKRQVHAVGPVDLDVGEGEFLGIVGPSGCGKSTLLRTVAGLVAPTSGRIDVVMSTDKRAPIAMVFQDYGIYPWKTVFGNVQFPMQLCGVARAERKERALYWIDRLGLGDFAHDYPDTLSGGMRQRVGIARAFALEPEILLMDEPFAALDAQLREVLQDELLAICQAVRPTVVFVTHSLEEAIILSDRVVVFSARPGVILQSITVPFPRPRSGEIRATSEFGALRAELWELLRGEIEPSPTNAPK